MICSLYTCALATSVTACGTEKVDVPQEQSASTEQKVITAAGNIMVWPAGPIVWDGLVGTWPISVWSPVPIGGLAFDVVGATGLGVGCLGLDGIVPVGISDAYLAGFGFGATAGVAAANWAPWLGPAGLFAPGFGFAGVYTPFVPDGFSYGFGAFAPWMGAFQASFVNGAVVPGFMPWLNPILTTNALMFNNLAVLNTFTPYTFNVTFTAASAAQAAAVQTTAFANQMALSIFATPIMPGALVAGAPIPFMSMVYPILPPLLPPAAIAPPLVAAPLL
jgi:hypothetical protein